MTHAGCSHAAKPDLDQQAVTKIKSNSGVNFVHTAHARKRNLLNNQDALPAEPGSTLDDIRYSLLMETVL